MKLFEPWEVRIARVMRRTGLPFNLARHSPEIGDPEDTKYQQDTRQCPQKEDTKKNTGTT